MEAERHDVAPKDEDATEKQTAHICSFDCIVKYVKESIFDGANVERLTVLKDNINSLCGKIVLSSTRITKQKI